LLAVAIFAAGTAVNFAVHGLGVVRLPLATYFPCLVLVGLYCGSGPAIGCLLFSAAAFDAFWLEPGGVLRATDAGDVATLLLFVASGAIVVAVAVRARTLLERDREQRGRLDMALSAGRMAAWDWDLTTGNMRLSEGAEAIFGGRWNPGDPWPFCEPEEMARIEQIVKSALDEGTHYSFTTRARRADTQAARWFETHGRVHRDESGHALRVSGLTLDVTDRQEALEASRAVEERFHLALESGKVTAWECDAQRRYTWLYNTQLGLAPADLVGRHIGETNRNEAYLAQVDWVYRQGRPADFQLAVPHGERVLHYLCFIRPHKDDQGRIERVLGASVDVTTLTEIREELQRENERKDAFLATLAHELRNPMAPIRYAVALLERNEAPALRQQAVDIISRQSAHMARLLDDLLDVSRITRNAIELKHEVIDLRRVAEQAVELARPASAEQQLRLTLSLPVEPVLIDGDVTRLLQVLGNLLDNAAKYTDGPGEVVVRLDHEGQQARLSVSDTGIGIRPDQRRQVFQLFSQLGQPGKSRGGLGIGLAVVKQLVELHGGEVDVHSEGEGLGSCFVVRLPTVAASSQTTIEPQTTSVVSLFPAGLFVLVVDDNRDAADTLALLLRADGFAVTVVYDGESALQAYDPARPTVVLLDLGLPGASGLEVARELRRRARAQRLVLVAVTGWGQERDKEQTRAAGFDAHLVKPVDPVLLEAMLRQQPTGWERQAG
jgi:two-component system CheB/CheR fusion protein